MQHPVGKNREESMQSPVGVLVSKPQALVYVASPLRIGDHTINVRVSIDAGEKLLAAGLTPVLPLLAQQWHLVYPKDPMEWLDYDLKLLSVCRAVVRLP